MVHFLNNKRSKPGPGDSTRKRSIRLFSSFFKQKVPHNDSKQSECVTSSSDKLDGSPVTPLERCATQDMHMLTASSHKVLTTALEQLSESVSTESDVERESRNVSYRRLFFSSSGNKSKQKDACLDHVDVFEFEPSPTKHSKSKQSYSQLRVRSDLLTVENNALRKRLSQLEMAEVERNCLQSRVSELEWALDVLRDDADRIREDALALIEEDFHQSFRRQTDRDSGTGVGDYGAKDVVEHIHSDDDYIR